MSTTDSMVGATKVLDRMHLPHHRSSLRGRLRPQRTGGRTAHLLGAFVLLAALVAGVPLPASAAGMTMTPNSISVVCSGSYVSIGRISGAGSNEVISFQVSSAAQFLPARSNTSGNYTVIWKCDPGEAGTQWNIVATGAMSGRSTSFTVVAEAPPAPSLPSAGTNLLVNANAEASSVAPWSIIDQSGTTTLAALTTSTAQSGTRILRASSGTASGGSVGQDVSGPIPAGQTFTYSIWARHPHADGAPQSASIVLETLGGQRESSVLAITVTDAWQRFDVTLSVVSAGHTGLRGKVVMLTSASAGRGTYDLDSASLVESSPNPIGALELVTGGQATVSVTGYAIDPNQPHDPVPIAVVIASERTEFLATVVRPDVAAMYPSAGPVHGFAAQVSTAQVGTRHVCIYAGNLGVGADTLLGCSSVTIGGSTSTTTPTTVPPTTVPPTTGPATTVPPTTAPHTTSPDPLGPQAFEPNRILSLFSAGDLDSMTNAFDFQAGDADTLRLYWAFFNREPDVAGAKYWIGLSRNGMTLDAMAYNFARSVEFQQRYGQVSDHAFLDIVYRNVLGRRYDSTGFEYWLSLINRGLPRSGAVRWIAANAEFVAAHPYPQSA